MPNLIIPAGYYLKVTTWENDGDYYATNELMGLTATDAQFYVKLVQKFKSRNNRSSPGLGNQHNSDAVLREVVDKLLAKYSDVSPDVRVKFKSEDLFSDALEEILGSPTDYEHESYGSFCRVVESFELYEIANPVEMLDVTEQFK